MDWTVGIFPEQVEKHLVFLLPAGKRTQESLKVLLPGMYFPGYPIYEQPG